jgi:hypothetical protein
MDNAEDLKNAIEKLHDCSAAFHESMPVKEMFKE